MAPPDSSPAARQGLRRQLQAARRALTPGARAHAARLIARHAERELPLRSGARVAVYAALPHELDTTPLIERARRRGCRLYLPRIDRPSAARGMRFIELAARLRRNRLGIEEPEGQRALGARWLDLVFLPLVGFDRHGVRLGTGGGYYDRAFAFRRWRAAWHAPLLVGIGFACQEVERLPRAAHDVLLDAVITEEGLIRCATG